MARDYVTIPTFCNRVSGTMFFPNQLIANQSRKKIRPIEQCRFPFKQSSRSVHPAYVCRWQNCRWMELKSNYRIFACDSAGNNSPSGNDPNPVVRSDRSYAHKSSPKPMGVHGRSSNPIAHGACNPHNRVVAGDGFNLMNFLSLVAEWLNDLYRWRARVFDFRVSRQTLTSGFHPSWHLRVPKREVL